MDISAMDPQGIQQLFDAEVLGPEGESIGTVEQIFADDVTGAPTFVTVKDAATGAETFLPVGGAGWDDKNVTVPFSKDVVDAAPAATGGDDLSPDRESEVYRYYGIRAPRGSRPRQDEPSPTWGQDVEDAPQPASDQPTPDQPVSDQPVSDLPEEGEPEQETVPDDATATTSLSQEEPQFDPAPEGLDAGSPDEFRSIEETDEQQEAAAPEPDADQTPIDELPAEETAVIAGGSFPFAATTAADGSRQSDEAEDAVADEEALTADESSEEQTTQEQVDEGEDALATPRADGESPEAAREDEPDAEEPTTADSEAEEPAGVEKGAPDENDAQPEESAAAAVPGLPKGVTLRTYTVTEMVTVQVPVTRDVVCWQDADGNLHELGSVPAPDTTAEASEKDAVDPANWWFEKSEDADAKEPSRS